MAGGIIWSDRGLTWVFWSSCMVITISFGSHSCGVTGKRAFCFVNGFCSIGDVLSGGNGEWNHPAWYSWRAIFLEEKQDGRSGRESSRVTRGIRAVWYRV
jgi:hypothetical protein